MTLATNGNLHSHVRIEPGLGRSGVFRIKTTVSVGTKVKKESIMTGTR